MRVYYDGTDITPNDPAPEEQLLSNSTSARPLESAPTRLIRRLRGQPAVEATTDRDLMARSKQGDGEAFGRLYQRYVDDVYLYVKARVGDNKLAEDLTQDAFLNAFRAVGRFHWQGQVRPWLLTIARNRVANHWRTVDRRPQLADLPEGEGDEGMLPVEGDARASLDAAERAIDLERLSGLIQRLTDLEREVIALRFGLELSVAETAQVMQRTEPSVRSLQYRAVQRFRDVLVSEDVTP